jgi:tight adherence protein C
MDPVLNGLIWIVASLSVAAGALALGISGAALLRERELAGRLSALLSSGGPHPSLVERGAQWLEWLGHMIARGESVNSELREALARAGYFRPAVLYIFLALRLTVTVGIFVTVILLRGGYVNVVNLAMAAIFAFLFYRYALIAVRYQGERRARRIQRELPPVLDIVLMVLDSGVSIDQCLQYVAVASRGSAPTVAPVLMKHIADVESGVPYDAALDRLGQRLAVTEGIDFANLLKQAMFQGGELGPSLRRFSAELSDRRLSRAREEGGRRGTYLTVVMVFFFVPVLMVVLVGPAFVNVAGTIKAAAQHGTQQK